MIRRVPRAGDWVYRLGHDDRLWKVKWVNTYAHATIESAGEQRSVYVGDLIVREAS